MVLPCVPQTPMQLGYMREIAPNSLARSKVGTPISFAAQSSGLSSSRAAVYTTISASPMFSARCSMDTGTPSERSFTRLSLSLLSDPVRVYPSFRRISASGHIPAPPMPIIWICFTCFNRSSISYNDATSIFFVKNRLPLHPASGKTPMDDIPWNVFIILHLGAEINTFFQQHAVYCVLEKLPDGVVLNFSVPPDTQHSRRHAVQCVFIIIL